jgi:pimeloyl-ACP methyl ester carboxylesterase
MKAEEGYIDVPGGKVGSQLVIIEDASHLCFAERPEEFNTVINSFMT